MRKYSIFYTEGSDFNANAAFDLVLNSTHPNTGSVGQIDLNTFNFNLKKSPALIIASVDQEGTALTVKKLVTFYGQVSIDTLKDNYRSALNGKFDNLPEGGGGEYDSGGAMGFPFGGNGGFFPFGGLPNLVWIAGMALSAMKFVDTQNPVYLGTGLYSYLHYRKNKNS